MTDEPGLIWKSEADGTCRVSRDIDGVVCCTGDKMRAIIGMAKAIDDLKDNVADAKRRCDSWERTSRAMEGHVRDLDSKAELTDRYERWLLDIGRLIGCEHLDDRLSTCVSEEFEKLRSSPDAQHVSNLVLLVGRLVQQVRKHDATNAVAEKAMDYLKRKDLLPSIVRGVQEFTKQQMAD